MEMLGQVARALVYNMLHIGSLNKGTNACHMSGDHGVNMMRVVCCLLPSAVWEDILMHCLL